MSFDELTTLSLVENHDARVGIAFPNLADRLLDIGRAVPRMPVLYDLPGYIERVARFVAGRRCGRTIEYPEGPLVDRAR